MANISRNFFAGKMNKSVDERLVPNGEYVDALNVRLGSTEDSDIGVVENSLGNVGLTQLSYNGDFLSSAAKCIGAFEDGANETLYWFVHDPEFVSSPTGKLDLIVSYDTKIDATKYHIISINDGGGINTTLNFDADYLITGVNKIEDLLFFTDNLNQPKKINVTKNYADPSANVDGFTEEAILVIKRPPLNSPAIRPIATSSQDNFLEDRFVSFAYRYQYEDGEYSATSQFSDPSFIPSTFNYDISTALNAGMLNSTNNCEITYNAGGKLVKSIDLLFKDMNSSTIKVIEKLDKSKLGLADNTDYTYTFSNSKIFTILPDSEILRLYDNVPKAAQAQTMMGNRLVYGNYLEGYDLVDADNNPTKLEYFTELETIDIGYEQIEEEFSNAAYTIDGSISIANGQLDIDLTGKDLVFGASISFSVRFSHSQFSGNTPFPSDENNSLDLDFTYILPQSFSSVYALATSVDFQEKIGIAANIQTVSDACDGLTLTDSFNCALLNQLNWLYKYQSGVNGVNEPVKIITSPSSQKISLVFPAIRYVNDPTFANITQNVYEYLYIADADIAFQEVSNPKSLHSNRGYETAIIYMDEYNRSTTALVSANNTIHVPCSASDTQNRIKVTIPTSQVAPSWATRYKFAVKPDKKDYDVIYSNFFFKDPTTGADYFLLEGQNSSKIQEGDELIVKADTQGARNNCTWTTVLEKDSKQADFLNPPPIDKSGAEIPIPAGAYMKLRANNFYTEVGDLPVIAYGELRSNGKGCRVIQYPVDVEDPDNPGVYIDYTIPAGSKIKMIIHAERDGIRKVPHKEWKVEADFTATQDYANFKDWFDGDNIAASLENQATKDPSDFEGPNYDSTLNADVNNRPCNVGNIYTNFWNTGSRSYFGVKSMKGYGGNDRKAADLRVTIEVIRAANSIVFESDPQDAEPDLWYESSESFAITENGEHEGNLQSQDFVLNKPAIIRANFFNCYAFGNGVESYKIEDSMTGKELVLGNRATTTDAKDYREERRFSDLTYSGIYNAESNVNKLNEFNGGLLNYKNLEQSFGPVMKLHGRETDILTLQEDKISYVLAGKNILSDASGGSALTSVPEVLGTQIARIEEYGISQNPESFASWGADKFFTDAKRGAVLQLKGSSAQSDQLQVISNFGMSSWFRDLFTVSFNTQKLGGYDPYMKEYVLTSNTEELPVEIPCIDCGITQTLTIKPDSVYERCYNLGELVGIVEIGYTVSQAESFEVTATYNGITTTSGVVSTSGKISFNKDLVNVEEVVITITSSSLVELLLNVACPQADEITIVLVNVTSDAESDEETHVEYRWSAGTFTSPLHSESVIFQSGNVPVVSLYKTITGYQGGGVIPSNGADVTLYSNKFGSDTYNFDINSDKLKYLRTDTLYNNNDSDINALLAASNNVTPIVDNSPVYSSIFTMPNTGQYLYLIWDYRDSTVLDLCFGDTAEDACCDCKEEPPVYTDCYEYQVSNYSTVDNVVFSYTGCDELEYNVTLTPDSDSEWFCAIENSVDIVGNIGVLHTGDQCFNDETPPVITLLGNAVESVSQGSAYNDAGATALDDVDGDITADIVVTNNVDTNVVGSYTVVYNVSDSSGNAAVPVTRIVNVLDETSPTLTVNPITVNIEVGGTYDYMTGVTANDNVDGDITADVVVTGTVDFNTIGSYSLTYNVSDSAGNAATPIVRTVNVVDTTSPVITLLGDANVSIPTGSTYVDAGATASDNYDGDITADIVTTNNVNTAVSGDYTVTYNVTDSSGNAASTVTRNVNVWACVEYTVENRGVSNVYYSYIDCDNKLVDNQVVLPDSESLPFCAKENSVVQTGGGLLGGGPCEETTPDTTSPVITLTGSSTVNIEVGDTYNDAGATASDDVDGNLTANIVTVNNVNTSVAGTYTVTYNVSDSSGNAATQVTRTVNVVEPTPTDTTPPVITILGDNPVTIELNSTYNDAGATALDNVDGDVSFNISTTTNVDTSTEGLYYVNYEVFDFSGNISYASRAVNVVESTPADTTPPTITLLGNNPITVELNSTYTDAGATAFDSVDGDLTANIIVSTNVNTSVEGNYYVNYEVSDAAGNTSFNTRSVSVVDSTPVDTTSPTITLVGPSTVSVVQEGTYTEQGATATDNVDGEITNLIVIGGDTVDTSVQGTYVVTYDVTDSSGNAASTVTRTVTVTAPKPTEQKYTVSDCETGDYYVVRTGTTLFDVGDVIQFYYDNDVTYVRCGTVQSSTSLNGDSSLYSQQTYFCGDSIHCYFSDSNNISNEQ